MFLDNDPSLNAFLISNVNRFSCTQRFPSIGVFLWAFVRHDERKRKKKKKSRSEGKISGGNYTALEVEKFGPLGCMKKGKERNTHCFGGESKSWIFQRGELVLIYSIRWMRDEKARSLFRGRKIFHRSIALDELFMVNYFRSVKIKWALIWRSQIVYKLNDLSIVMKIQFFTTVQISREVTFCRFRAARVELCF